MYTVDPSTQAALPGGLIISPQRFARYFAPICGPAFLLRLATQVSYRFSMSTGILRMRSHLWMRTLEHFLHGCLCPGRVLDAKRGVVGVFANLHAAGEGSVPVVRVLRERLDMIPASKAVDGAKVAAVSVYHATKASLQLGRWSDFSPMVVDTLVENPIACNNAEGRLSPLAWQALDMALAQLPPGARDGQYSVDVPHEITWNAF